MIALPRLTLPSPRDPLALALLVSLAVHAVILAIRIVPPGPLFVAPQDTALEVVLLNAVTASRPVKADVIAQADSEGGGEREQGRAKSPLPMDDVQVEGEAVLRRQRQVQALEAEQRRLAALADTLGRDVPAGVQPTAPVVPGRDDEDVRLAMEKLQAQVSRQLEAYDKRPRRLTYGVNARGASYARYVDAWATRVERLGTERMPAYARGRYGELVVTAEVDRHGNVVDVQAKADGVPAELVRAAREIVYAGAPYERFPAEMAKEGDILQIVRTWHFTRGALETEAARR